MKFCPNCGTQLEEGAAACPSCGAAFAAPAQPYVDPSDHTAEFDASDISDNKVFAMLPYVLGLFGVIISLLAHIDSPYTKFHVRQYLKLAICQTIVGIVSAVLGITIIVPIVGGVCLAILFVLRIIGFFHVCRGLAKEPAIVSRLKFLK